MIAHAPPDRPGLAPRDLRRWLTGAEQLSPARDGPRMIDLFCGAGGLTLGFVAAGFRPVWANDTDSACVDTYRANFGGHVHEGDLTSLLRRRPRDIPKADVVIGGPPCQGFSLLNKNRDGDPRNALWRAFWRVVERAEPRAFVMENVPELLNSREFEGLRRRASQEGFALASGVLLAADYGVPQCRRRAFIIGMRDHAPALPPPTHASPDLARELRRRPWLTVRDAIGMLPPPVGDELRRVPPPADLHFGRNPTQVSLERYRAVPAGGNRFDLQRRRPDITPRCWIRKTSGGTDLFGRLWWDRPSVTIRTEFFKPEKGRYLHPEQDRPITHREAARLQTFPDNFTFTGGKIRMARQIGNAVPVLLGRAVAEAVHAAAFRGASR